MGITVALFAAAAAVAADAPSLDELPEALAALPDHEARRALLKETLAGLSDPDEITRIANAMKVLDVLAEQGRTDSVTVRSFAPGALSADAALRASTLQAASGEPAAQPAPAPTPPPAADPAAIKAYAAKRLYRDSLQVMVGGGASAWDMGGGTTMVTYRAPTLTTTWAIYDGSGRALTAPEFAKRAGDAAGVERLKKARRQADIGGLSASLVGAGLLGGFLYTLGELSDAENPDKLMGPLIGTGVGGAVLFGAGIGVPMGIRVRQQGVAGCYSATEADQWVASHNAAVRESMSLSEADVLPIDLGR